MKRFSILLIALFNFASAQLGIAQVQFQSPIKNAGFEEPTLPAPTGAIQDWVSNSLKGTGTYPLPYKAADGRDFPATPHGKQSGVIAEGGYIGTLILNGDGTPLPIVPGTKISLSFHNIIPLSEGSGNMGVYLTMKNQDGVAISQPVSVRNCKEVDGRITVDFTIYPEGKLDAIAPEWRTNPPFIKLQNFAGFVILDEVQISVTGPANQ